MQGPGRTLEYRLIPKLMTTYRQLPRSHAPLTLPLLRFYYCTELSCGLRRPRADRQRTTHRLFHGAIVGNPSSKKHRSRPGQQSRHLGHRDLRFASIFPLCLPLLLAEEPWAEATHTNYSQNGEEPRVQSCSMQSESWMKPSCLRNSL